MDFEKRRIERFWCKVEKTEKCWIWIGYIDQYGYGEFCSNGFFKTKKAHRISYELIKGKIPNSLQLDHLCRTRNCVNPTHLEPVTGRVNTARTPRALKKYCKNGHKFSEENTYLNQGHRVCRICHKIYMQNRRSLSG